MTRLECIQGDIAAQQDMDAVVNAANAWLRTGGGVVGAIHKAAGPELYQACKPWAPIHPGEAVITPAFNLPNRYMIHCLGPVYRVDEPADKLLAACYRNALQLAEDNAVRSIAFPAISAGAFGYPLDAAASVAFTAIRTEQASLVSVAHIRFVLFSKTDADVHRQILTQMSHDEG